MFCGLKLMGEGLFDKEQFVCNASIITETLLLSATRWYVVLSLSSIIGA